MNYLYGINYDASTSRSWIHNPIHPPAKELETDRTASKGTERLPGSAITAGTSHTDDILAPYSPPNHSSTKTPSSCLSSGGRDTDAPAAKGTLRTHEASVGCCHDSDTSRLGRIQPPSIHGITELAIRPKPTDMESLCHL